MFRKNKIKVKVNVKARLNRHLKIAKENIGKDININNSINFHYVFVLFFLLLVFPFYPRISSWAYNTSQTEFYRGDIDESSIIESYFGGNEGESQITGFPILESTDSFISVNTILNDERDLEGTNEIIDYEVKPGESFYSISYKFKVSTDSIYWANDFGKSYMLRPGDIIKVPPVTGLIYQVKSGDTIKAIAKKYDTPESKIIEQNSLSGDFKLVRGEVIVIPGAIKKAPPKPQIVHTIKKSVITKTAKTAKYTIPKGGRSKYVQKQGKFKLNWRKPFSGEWGNCTYYVASYKNVNWRGNANRWLKNARAKGNATGNKPEIGAIVAFEGRGYNPKYGHVAIVMDIQGNSIIVSEMNYRRLNEVTYRKVLINDKRITGYIYVN